MKLINYKKSTFFICTLSFFYFFYAFLLGYYRKLIIDAFRITVAFFLKMFMRKFFGLWLFLIMFSSVSAQQSILEEINTTLSDGNRADTVTQKEGVRDSLRNAHFSRNLKKDTTKLSKQKKVKDSTSNPLRGKQEEELQSIDTQLFKQRMMEVKRPVTDKQLHSEKAWSKESRIINSVTYDKKHMLDTSYEVFGWHPYWCGEAYKSYNYSLLSMISYFSYEVNPETGFYSDIHSWKKTALIDSAKKYNCKVLLTLTNFGEKANKTFLRSKEARKNLISTAITLIRERKADGLTLDFENVRSEEKSFLTDFIIDLSNSLKEEDEDYILTVALPAVDFEKVYEFSQINNYVDLFVMMGYEYHGENSEVAGPIAPLSNGKKWNGFTLESSVDEYIANGVPMKKLLLGVPYYGAEWITENLKFPSTSRGFVDYLSYRESKRLARRAEDGDLDGSSMSKFYAYSDGNSNYRQMWFEDSTTLAAKYDWIKNKKIGGVGIWALGYDNGHDELWKLLAEKFAYSEEEVEKIERNRRKISFRKIMRYAKRLIKNPKSIITRPRAFLRLFGAFAGVSVIGLFIVIRYSKKFKRLFKLILKGGIAAIVIVTLASIFIFLRYFELKELLFLIGGFLLGLILFLFFSRRYISEKDLP